jgi:D-sedoheptulose 7-phosphate isomerase
MNNQAYIADFLGGIEKICADINREHIGQVVEVLYDAWRNDKQVFLIGNGGSAGTATHMACDLNKCTIFPNKKRMRVLALVDNIPLVSALTNDDGWENVYVEQLKNFYRDGDVILGISVHGGKGKDKAGAWSQNLLKAMQYVKDNGGKVLGFSGFDGGAFKEVSDVCITVPYNTTPHVEAFHVTLHHLVTFLLAEKIRES